MVTLKCTINSRTNWQFKKVITYDVTSDEWWAIDHFYKNEYTQSVYENFWSQIEATYDLPDDWYFASIEVVE